MQLRGVVGRLQRGYAVAAELGPYTVTRNVADPCCQLTATITRVVDAFQLTQPGLQFATPVGTRTWTFGVEACVIERQTVTAQLSARPEVE